MAEFKNNNLLAPSKKFVTEEEVREIIAAALANWTGVTRFRTIESVVTTITDFTNSQHNHTGSTGGGQLTDAALSTAVTVPKGGTGVNTLASGSILVGAGAGAVTTQTTVSAAAKVYYVSDTSGGAVTRKLTFTNGVLSAEV
jgi:hypothetical protein